MTIAEAAAFGVPTLLHHGTIGAKDLLPEVARFDTDMADVAVAGEVMLFKCCFVLFLCCFLVF